MSDLQSVILTGKEVELMPLDETHYVALYEAAQAKQIWIYSPVNGFGKEFSNWFEKAWRDRQEKQHLLFVVKRLADGKLVGSTRLYDIKFNHSRLAIGYTWYTPEVWGTNVNPESKYLLLQYAYEQLNVNRTEFYVDSRNVRSKIALIRLGAKEEGTLRQHLVLEDGFIRDSVVFSIIKSEWPEIKANLRKMLYLQT